MAAGGAGLVGRWVGGSRKAKGLATRLENNNKPRIWVGEDLRTLSVALSY